MEKTVVPDSNRPDYKVTAAEMQRYRTPQAMRMFTLGLSLLLILLVSMLFIQGKKITNLEENVQRLERQIQNSEDKIRSLENRINSLVGKKAK